MQVGDEYPVGLARAVIEQVLDKSKIGIKSGNERNLKIKLARCCNPTIGDAIIGYVSRGRGIIVHRADCPNRIHIKDFGERMIDVEWETVSPKATKRFRVTARFTSDLFSEIEGTLRKYKGHLIEGKLEENINETLNGFFPVELDNREDFNKVLKNLRTIPAIVNIQPVQVF
jgi:guanosine-3',5'-bis(diphosphate) 3'-pyrophosphohydrolase